MNKYKVIIFFYATVEIHIKINRMFITADYFTLINLCKIIHVMSSL